MTDVTPSPYADDLTLALTLADAADAITMARFEITDLAVESIEDTAQLSFSDAETDEV